MQSIEIRCRRGSIHHPVHKEPEGPHLRPLRAKRPPPCHPRHLVVRTARLSPLFALGGAGGALGGQALAGRIALGEVVGAALTAGRRPGGGGGG